VIYASGIGRIIAVAVDLQAIQSLVDLATQTAPTRFLWWKLLNGAGGIMDLIQ
jgi:hypothetical protein